MQEDIRPPIIDQKQPTVASPIEPVVMLPILEVDNEKDERFEGVLLIDGDDETKKTAEDCGLWWYIRDWEIQNIDGSNYWFARSGFSLSKSMVNKLAT